MRKTQIRRPTARNTGLICATMVVLGSAGCLVDFPTVSRTGHVVDGDPKLNALVKCIASLRVGSARKADGVVKVMYFCSLNPTWQSVAYAGSFPETPTLAQSDFVVVCAAEVLASSNAAALHEVALRADAKRPPRTRYILLFWRAGTWTPRYPYLLEDRRESNNLAVSRTTTSQPTSKFTWEGGKWSWK
jgi:hypothetical protein